MRRSTFSRDFYIPKNSIAITEPGLGAVYVSSYVKQTDGKPRYHAVAFTEKANKPSWNLIFKQDTQLDGAIAGFFNGIRADQQMVKDRRTADYGGHNFKVGDIITNSWGYDQTNVDWYAVTRISKNYVWIRPVCAELDHEYSEGYGPCGGRETLRLDENLKPIFTEKGEETKHRATGWNVTMKFGCGSLWNGEKQYSSWGH